MTRTHQFRERSEGGQTEVVTSTVRVSEDSDTMAHYNGRQGNAAAAFSVGAEADPELKLNGDAHADACPEDAIETQITALPSEFDKYLVGDAEVNWGPVKFELGLEEQTASLTIQEHRRLEFQQAGPSTSSVYSSMLVTSEYLIVLWREGRVGVALRGTGSRG